MPDPNSETHRPPPAPKRAATFTTSSTHSPDTLSSAPTPRFRGPTRKSSAQSLDSSSHSRSPNPRPAPNDRRSSTFSLSSIDELSNSFTGDIINPSFTRRRSFDEDEDGGRRDEEEVTNWHSTPLLFALLPAVGGVLFKEGAAVVTDLLILGLAAIFLNWSLRLPWDWYFASQRVVREARGRRMEGEDEDEVLIEGDETDEMEGHAGQDEDQGGGADGEQGQKEKQERDERLRAISERREAALAGLRTQETLALTSTFLFPALAAYLLHVLRGQLSKPSTGLVSDYNLSIFLLVAEIRPCRQLIRLIKRRTLHLQRTAAGPDDPFATPPPVTKETIAALTFRLQDLETHIQKRASAAESTMNGHAPGKKPSQLDDELKRRYDSRLDALERAVRRYEKRTTTLAMVTEQRLRALDARVGEVMTLAAVAASESRRRRGGPLDVLLAAVTWPVRVLGTVVLWPVRVLEGLYERVVGLLFGRPAGGRAGKRGGKGKRMEDWDSTPPRKVERSR